MSALRIVLVDDHTIVRNGLRVLLERLLSDEGLRLRTINLGKDVSRELTWDRCARATAGVYGEILEEICGSRSSR